MNHIISILLLILAVAILHHFQILPSLLLSNVDSDGIDNRTCGKKDGECKTYAFNTHGFPLKQSFNLLKSDPLTLQAAGMRRKNLYVTTVDVYSVGIYMNDKKRKETQKLAKEGKSLQLNRSIGSFYESDIMLVIVLKFVRSVSNDKVVTAIVEALTDNEHADEQYNTALKTFQDLLSSKMGVLGVKDKDEIQFLFKSKSQDEFGISINASQIQWIKNSKLRGNLIDIYTDKSKAVAPEVVTTLTENILY